MSDRLARRASISTIAALAALGCGAPPIAESTRETIEVTCQSGARHALVIDRRCTTDTDCVAAAVAIDCCGTARAFGIAARDRERFSAFEHSCGPPTGLCECLAEPTITDDGTQGDGVRASCRAGRCATAAY